MSATVTLRNETGFDFVDISSEQRRCYKFPGGDQVIIDYPQWLSVAPSGGHRIVDLTGVCYYIPYKWISLTWFPRRDEPHFVR